MLPNGFNYRLIWLLAAGLCGSIVGLGMNPSVNTPWRKLVFLFSGLCCTFFLASPIATHFGLHDPGEIAGVGFVVAIFWQQIVGKVAGIVDTVNIPGGKR